MGILVEPVRKKAKTAEADALKDYIEKVSEARWLARTNMYYLCNKILGFRDVQSSVHYGLVDTLQGFVMPPDNEKLNYDRPYFKTADKLSWNYKPFVPMLDLPGERRRLILDFRGSLKTTCNIIAHTIQWLINYPDARILIVHAKEDKAMQMLDGVKQHFLMNPVFRELFPELCPPEEYTKRYGNASCFDVWEGKGFERKESSVACTGMNSSIAGDHYDVIKFTDCVDEENTANIEMRTKVSRKFQLFFNVLVSRRHWIDVEGTRYHFDDLYGRILLGEASVPVENREWRIYVRGCYKKQLPPGQTEYLFSAEELDLPDLKELGPDGRPRPVSWWPERHPVDALMREESNPTRDVYEFNSQMRNHPVGDLESADFPASCLLFVPSEEFKKIRIEFMTTTVDSAETNNAQSNYSAIITCAWDSNNRAYVVDIRRAKLQPDELIDEILEVYKRWHPIVIRIEKTSFTSGLETGLKREMHSKGFSLPFDFVRPENQKSKERRIRDTLRPVLKNGDLRFVDHLPGDIKDAVYQEFTRFPRGGSDDIIDAISDQFQNKDYYGRIRERPSEDSVRQKAFDNMLWGTEFEENWGQISVNDYYFKTGGL